MADWFQVLEGECDRAKSDYVSLLWRFTVTSGSLVAIVSTGATIASSRGVTFDIGKYFLPVWVGVELISMGISFSYTSYEHGVAPLLRQASKATQQRVLTPVWLLQSATFFLMFIGSLSVFLSRHSLVVYIAFGCVAVLTLVVGWMVLKSPSQSVAEAIIGPPSRSRDSSKRVEQDIRRFVAVTLTSAILYLAIGGLLVWLVWDGPMWSTALSLSILAAVFIGLIEKSYNQYAALVVARQVLFSLEMLRIDTLTSREVDENRIRESLRSIKGLPPTSDGDPQTPLADG